MEILIADDDASSLILLAGLVRKFGHTVVAAVDGAQALQAFEARRPDLVLIDGQMPVMDGYAATARMRARSEQDWVPILFVTADTDRDSIVRALDAGADDYLSKPVHPEILRAKLASIERLCALRNESEQQKHRLQNYHDAAEQESRIALHLMKKLVNAELLKDPMLDYSVVPISPKFCGDLVAAARTPRGTLHLMLADAVGHGLAAALNVLPIVPCFYSMSAKGFDIDMIAVELNRTLRQYMPVDRFVASTLIAVDTQARQIKVWNGANPPVLVFDGAGAMLARFESKNLALGILPHASFDPMTQTYVYADNCQLFACSDGVVEGYGVETDDRQLHIERMLMETPPALRAKRMRNALAARAAEGSARDDMTMLLVKCEANAAAELPALPRMPAQLNFDAIFNADDLREIDVVALLLDVLASLPGAHYHRRQLGVIITELFANALDHGVLGLPSHLKNGEHSYEAYEEARAQALSRLTQGSIAVRLETHMRYGQSVLDIQFRDSGAGFDAAAGDTATAEMRHGRGIRLVESLCAGVAYNPPGNDVCATYLLEMAPTMSPPALSEQEIEFRPGVAVNTDSRLCMLQSR